MLAEKYSNYYDKEAIYKIWSLAWPVMVGQFLHTMMVVADMWFIAQLGSVEAAAAGTGTSLIGVIQVLTAFVASGTIALVSRYTGADDKEAIKKISINSIVLSIITGLMVTALSFVYIDGLLKIFGNADINMLQLSRQYISVALIGIPLFFYNHTTKAIIQATGDTKNPVKIFIFMNIINIVLDYLFIMVWGRGIAGAATATVIAEAIGFICMSGLVFRNIYSSNLHNIIQSIELKINTGVRIFKIGFFAVLQMITRPLTGLIMFRIVLTHGVETGAAFGIGGRMFNFVFIFLAGLGTALSVLVGQYLGKRDVESVHKLIRQGLWLATLNMLAFSILFFLFPRYIMMFFTRDAEVIRIGILYLRITYAGVIFVIFSSVYGAAFAGAGDTLPPMLASILGNWGVKIPLAYLLSNRLNMSSNGVWIAISLSVVVEALFMAMWFYRGNWKSKII